jgi:hypothetical protein
VGAGTLALSCSKPKVHPGPGFLPYTSHCHRKDFQHSRWLHCHPRIHFPVQHGRCLPRGQAPARCVDSWGADQHGRDGAFLHRPWPIHLLFRSPRALSGREIGIYPGSAATHGPEPGDGLPPRPAVHASLTMPWDHQVVATHPRPGPSLPATEPGRCFLWERTPPVFRPPPEAGECTRQPHQTAVSMRIR